MRRLSLTLVLALILGCGKAGPPRPPVPQIPRAANDLLVAQQGPILFLTWSFPTLTTAGTTLRSIERMRVFRYVEDLPVTALRPLETGGETSGEQDHPPALRQFEGRTELAPQQFLALRHEIAMLEGDEIPQAIAGGRLTYPDRPPLQTTDARPVRIYYAVVLEGDQGPSELSNLVSIVPVGVPLSPTDPRWVVEPGVVAMSWAPPTRSIFGEENPPIAGYNIYRASDGEALVLESPVNEAPVNDRVFRDRPSYGEHRYFVTAVSEMDLQRSESDPLEIGPVDFVDLEDPPAPANVVTLAEESAIRVVWDAVEAPDFAGYNVYRETPRGTVTLTHEPITQTSFRDTRLEPGITYIYWVTTVDTAGNESGPTKSEPVLSPMQSQ